jgi:hypothetical protein
MSSEVETRCLDSDHFRLLHFRHPVLDTGLGFFLETVERGSPAPCRARGDDAM